MRRIDLIPLTLNIKCHWLKLNCLFKSLCRPTQKKISMVYIDHCSSDRSSLFGIPSKNTTFIENLKQLGCLFNRFFLLTKKNPDSGWNWLDSPDKRASMSKCHWMHPDCLLKSFCRPTPKKTPMVYITVPLFAPHY